MNSPKILSDMSPDAIAAPATSPTSSENQEPLLMIRTFKDRIEENMRKNYPEDMIATTMGPLGWTIIHYILGDTSKVEYREMITAGKIVETPEFRALAPEIQETIRGALETLKKGLGYKMEERKS